MKKTIKNKIKPARKTGKNQNSISMYWLGGIVKYIGILEAEHYAGMDSSIQVWVKASRKDVAVALAKRQLAGEGWRVQKFQIGTKVDAGFARIISMMDPLAFSEDEADEWTDQYFFAAKHGFACTFAHCDKEKENATGM